MKKFSIIIPTFNCADLLRSTLNSIFLQDDSLFECIIVDGNSRDNTVKVILEFKAKYPDNLFFISEGDKGIYDAMNKGIKLSSGEYLYFIGAGDTLHSGVLKKVNEFIDKEGSDFIYGKVYMKHQNRVDGFCRSKEDSIYSIICHQSIFYKRSIFDKVGMYSMAYKAYSDTVLNYSVFGRDDISKSFIDLIIADYLGGGFSEQNIDEAYLSNYGQIIVDSYGRGYLKGLYGDVIDNLKSNRRFIGWAISKGYEDSQKYHRFKLDYLIDSSPKNHNLYKDGLVIKSPQNLLSEHKEDIYILVFSHTYYNEIRAWLLERGFYERADFTHCSESFLKILNELDLNF